MDRILKTSNFPLFLPIVFLVGIVLSVWGGVLVQQQARAGRLNQLIISSEKKAADVSVKWSLLNGALQSYSLMMADGGAPNVDRLSQIAASMTNDNPAIEHTWIFKGNARQLRPILVHGEAEIFDAAQIAKHIGTSVASRTPDNKLVVLPFTKLNVDKNLPEHFVWGVMPFAKHNGWVVVLIDLHELMGEGFMKLAEGAAAPDVTIEMSNGLEQHVFTKPANYEEYDHKNTVTIGGVEWHFNWSFRNISFAGSYGWGLFVSMIGLMVTLVLVWTLWSQFSVARRVRSEVITRTKELEQASRRFRLITDNAYDLIAITTLTGDFEYINSAYNRVLGFSKQNVSGRNVSDFVHADDTVYLRQAIEAVVNGRPVSEVSFRMQSKKNEWVYLEAVAKGIFDNSWNLTGIVMHCRDVTARKKYADELARSEKRFKDFADSSADWLWEVNKNFVFSYVSPGVKSTLGYTPEDMMGRTMFDALFASGDDAARELLEGLAKRHQPYRELEFWTRTKMGERVCLRLSGIPVFDDEGNFDGYRGAATNITSSKVDRENMLRLATTDHLTGLLNRNRFMEELEHTIALARRHNTQGVVLFIDLDRFKAVNDTHGHEAGDEVIRSIANILKKSVRSTDVVSRLAGDEFAVIMHNVDTKQAQEKVNEIIDRVNKMRVEYKGAKLQVTMSVGMIGYPQSGKDASQLLTSADLAMYRAKDMGRNRLYIDEGLLTSSKTSATVREQLEWIDRLRTALDEDKFEMHYQPIVPCGKDKHTIYEALIRLRDEDGNLGAPALFIDAAEHFGMIRDLDRAVVERCIKKQAELEKSGKPVVFSINLSGMSFGDDELLQSMKKYFKKYKADPTKFIFEVTETAAMRDIDEAREFVSELKKMGSKFALDDFGVGFSSFFYIKHLEVDYIKIDGSYIKNLDSSAEDRLFVKSLVDLASGLEIETVAEFVENQAILDELERMNVTYVQGYHLSRPEEDIDGLFTTFDNQQATAVATQIAAAKNAASQPVKKVATAKKAAPKKAATIKTAPKKAAPKKPATKKATGSKAKNS